MAVIRGVVTQKSTPQTGANYSTETAVAWDQDLYDTDNFHDSAGGSTQIIIPSAVNGVYGIFTATISASNVQAASNIGLRLLKGASLSYIGSVAHNTNTVQGNGQSTTNVWIQVVSPPVLLATGDAYTVALTCNDTSITINTESSFGLYICDQANLTQRCWAKLNADQTAKDFSTPTAITFDGTDAYDTDGIHDPSGTPTKLIIPSALNGKAGVVNASVGTALNTGNLTMALGIRRNGSLTYPGFGGTSGQNQSGATAAEFGVQTQVIQFNTGDEFEALFYNVDTSITLSNNSETHFALWVYNDAPISATSRSFGTIIGAP